MMCVPMLDLDGEPMGVINIDTQNPLNQFGQEDLDLLMAVAGQAALSLRKRAAAGLAHGKAEAGQRNADCPQRAAGLAARKLSPGATGTSFSRRTNRPRPSAAITTTALSCPTTQICLSFGDVAGKGVPAALIMSRMSSVVQNTMAFVDDVDKADRGHQQPHVRQRRRRALRHVRAGHSRSRRRTNCRW